MLIKTNDSKLKKAKKLLKNIDLERKEKSSVPYMHYFLKEQCVYLDWDEWLSLTDNTPFLVTIEERNRLCPFMFFKEFVKKDDSYRIYFYNTYKQEVFYIGNASILEKSFVLFEHVVQFHYSSCKFKCIIFQGKDYKFWHSDLALYRSTLWDEENYYKLCKTFYDLYTDKYDKQLCPVVTFSDVNNLLENSNTFIDMLLKAFFATTEEEKNMTQFYAGFGDLFRLMRPKNIEITDYGIKTSFADSMYAYQLELSDNFVGHGFLFHTAKAYMCWVWQTMYDDASFGNIQILKTIKKAFPKKIPNSFRISFINGVSEYTTGISKENLLRSLMRDDFQQFFEKKFTRLPFCQECDSIPDFAYSSKMVSSIYVRKKEIYSQF